MATTCIQNPPVVTPVKSPIPDKEVSTALQGTVLDEKNAPVAGATVKCGNIAVNRDAKGCFRIPCYSGRLCKEPGRTISQDSVANPVPYPLNGSFRIRITQ